MVEGRDSKHDRHRDRGGTATEVKRIGWGTQGTPTPLITALATTTQAISSKGYRYVGKSLKAESEAIMITLRRDY